MSEAARHDAWQAGDNYDAYMGRWSRQLAPRFLDWLQVAHGLDWLEIGCGTGALSAAIVARCDPRSLIAIEPSAGFVAAARANVPDSRAQFQVGDAQSLPLPADSVDVVASALVLNFIPDRPKALAEMQRVARPGATIAFYVWDYAGGGLEFLRAFWQVAATLDPGAADLTEDKRFPFCTADALLELAQRSGLKSAECSAIELPTVFKDFDDYWRPFTLGAGPAPGYCAGLAPEARQRLQEGLRGSLPYQRDGSIALQARAWAIRATAA